MNKIQFREQHWEGDRKLQRLTQRKTILLYVCDNRDVELRCVGFISKKLENSFSFKTAF